MIDYLSKINYLSIKLITCQNKLITDQKMIDYSGQNYHYIATHLDHVACSCQNFTYLIVVILSSLGLFSGMDGKISNRNEYCKQWNCKKVLCHRL